MRVKNKTKNKSLKKWRVKKNKKMRAQKMGDKPLAVCPCFRVGNPQ